MKVALPCEALVDQGRYIGKDPVGYSCSQPATTSYSTFPGSNVLLCDSCARLLKTAKYRLTLIFRSDAQRDAAVKSLFHHCC